MDEAIIRLGNIAIYGFGLLAVFSFLWGSFVFYKKATESHFEDASIFDGVVLAAFWGFIGGRLFFVVFFMGSFWDHWSRIFFFNDFSGIYKWGGFFWLALGG